MINARVALPPKCEAPRQTHAGVGRGTTNFINSNVITDSITDLRLQRLQRIGVVDIRAALLAPLAWGEAA
jgi:hypothetical protein